MSSGLNSVLCGQLDFKGATIQGNLEDFDAPISLPNQNSNLSLVSLDIGGTLIKLVYLMPTGNSCVNLTCEDSQDRAMSNEAFHGGRLEFVKFETKDIGDSGEFICNKLLHKCKGSSSCLSKETMCRCAKIMATGGGAHKYEDLFNDSLGFTFHKIDEIDGVVACANFLLKVNGEGKADLFTASNIGASTMLGLARVLTKCKSYDHFLKLSQLGHDSTLDLTVGDVYGEMGYPKISYLAANHLGIKKVFFGGSFTIGHSDTMERISNELGIRSQGQMQAIFLRHEGFLGALGALMNYRISDAVQAIGNNLPEVSF
ncbi:pantothenate kinase 2 [Quillaja saponaria]|uniref:Pantothenate kinase 2 n=1 Tax=Quillaja saponaria TaxID=32244 RepID=A0AAD7PM06_QUISA|nr:pantothenate kinase 2 [Quillaja saponaria]